MKEIVMFLEGCPRGRPGGSGRRSGRRSGRVWEEVWEGLGKDLGEGPGRGPDGGSRGRGSEREMYVFYLFYIGFREKCCKTCVKFYICEFLDSDVIFRLL